MKQSDSYSAPTLDVDLTDGHADEGQPEATGAGGSERAAEAALADGTSARADQAAADDQGPADDQGQADATGADTKGPEAAPVEIGYRGTTAHTVAGITYRQLDYWARTGLVVPSIRDASGSGTQRLYSFRDIVVLKVVKRLLDAGVSLQNIRKAIETLRRRGVEDLANVTLISDGTTVYECRSAEEIVDLLQGGQGVFAIALSGPFREIQGTLAKLPAAEVVTDTSASASSPQSASAPAAPVDELAIRRARRRAG